MFTAPIYSKILAIIIIFIGEALAIYAEVAGAKSAHAAAQPVFQLFWKMFAIVTVASGFLIAGYMLGYKSFQNIWVVSTVSITSILIIEPILNSLIFGQMPTTGAIIGLTLGAVGFLFAIFL